MGRARRSDEWRYPYRPEPDLRVDTGTGAAGAPCEPGKKQGNAVSLSGVNDKVYALAQLYNLPEDVLPVCNECRMVYPAYTSHDPRRPDKLR